MDDDNWYEVAPLPCRRVPSAESREWRARDRERPLLQLRRSGNRCRGGRPSTMLNQRCTPPLWFVANCGSRSLRSVAARGRKISGPAHRLLCPCTHPALPRGQRYRFCVRACTQTIAAPAPDLQYQQLQLRLRGLEPWRFPAATGKPCT